MLKVAEKKKKELQKRIDTNKAWIVSAGACVASPGGACDAAQKRLDTNKAWIVSSAEWGWVEGVSKGGQGA
jgi:hypothetical protein